MNKIEIFVSVAIGQIAMIIAMLKKMPQSSKTKRWIVGLKAASAALAEIVSDNDTTDIETLG